MTKISRKEILKIAQLSRLELRDDEIPALMSQLERVLTYAERVQEIVGKVEEPSSRNVNVFREDVIVRCDAQEILAQAPEREGDYFVVPKIIESN